MKRFLSAALALAMAASALAGCSGTSSRGTAGGPVQTSGAAQVTPMSAATETLKAPKYVFLFIGDGMSYPCLLYTSGDHVTVFHQLGGSGPFFRIVLTLLQIHDRSLPI